MSRGRKIALIAGGSVLGTLLLLVVAAFVEMPGVSADNPPAQPAALIDLVTPAAPTEY